MRALVLLGVFAMFAVGCAAETTTHASVDGTELTLWTLHDDARADDDATSFGVRIGDDTLGAPKQDDAFSFQLRVGD